MSQTHGDFRPNMKAEASWALSTRASQRCIPTSLSTVRAGHVPRPTFPSQNPTMVLHIGRHGLFILAQRTHGAYKTKNGVARRCTFVADSPFWKFFRRIGLCMPFREVSTHSRQLCTCTPVNACHPAARTMRPWRIITYMTGRIAGGAEGFHPCNTPST